MRTIGFYIKESWDFFSTKSTLIMYHYPMSIYHYRFSDAFKSAYAAVLYLSSTYYAVKNIGNKALWWITSNLPKFFANFYSFHKITYGFTFVSMSVSTSKAPWFTTNYTHGKTYTLEPLIYNCVFPSSVTTLLAVEFAVLSLLLDVFL